MKIYTSWVINVFPRNYYRFLKYYTLLTVYVELDTTNFFLQMNFFLT